MTGAPVLARKLAPTAPQILLALSYAVRDRLMTVPRGIEAISDATGGGLLSRRVPDRVRKLATTMMMLPAFAKRIRGVATSPSPI